MTVARETFTAEPAAERTGALPGTSTHPLLEGIRYLDGKIASWVRSVIEPQSARTMRRLLKDGGDVDLLLFGQSAVRHLRTGVLEPNVFTYRRFKEQIGS